MRKTIMTMVIVLAASQVFAAENEVSVAVTKLLTDTVFPVLGAFLMGIASWVLAKLGAKYKVQGLTDQNGLLMQLASQGIAFAEERAANFAKANVPQTGNDKLNSAIAFILLHAPKVTEDQARSLAVAALATIPGIGATGEQFVAQPGVTVNEEVKIDASNMPEGVEGTVYDPLQVSPN